MSGIYKIRQGGAGLLLETECLESIISGRPHMPRLDISHTITGGSHPQFDSLRQSIFWSMKTSGTSEIPCSDEVQRKKWL